MECTHSGVSHGGLPRAGGKSQIGALGGILKDSPDLGIVLAPGRAYTKLASWFPLGTLWQGPGDWPGVYHLLFLRHPDEVHLLFLLKAHSLSEACV